MTKVEECTKRRAIHTISSDVTNEVKENGVNYTETTENISLSTEISKIVRELGHTMTTIKTIIEEIQKESEPQMQKQNTMDS